MLTCVAARFVCAHSGLDVPDVDYVVHYQMPRSAELYIHRSGRTARAGAKGMTLLLVGESAQEQKHYRTICHVLGKPRVLAHTPALH